MALVVKNPPANGGNARDMGSIPGLKDSLCRKWQYTPVFLPGKSHGQRRLVGYSLWGRKELYTIMWLSVHARARARTHTHTPLVACGSDAQWWCPEHWVDNTEQWSLGKHSRIPEATGYNIFINQSIRNLFRDTLLNTYCTFINTELTANSTVTSAWMYSLW